MSQKLATALLIVWLVLLVPWFMLAPWAAMVFDGGVTWSAYLIVWSIWTYPLTVIAGAALRKKAPAFVLLPFLNVLGLVIAR
ncbi:MAG: hypothetical protein LAO20_07645 [Acidobacteriia bacterium]|nr:hypothetical protein [Terriglobia bacterium]